MNVLFVHFGTDLLDSILSNTDWNIEVLIENTDMHRMQYQNLERISKIYIRDDFHFNSDFSSFDYSLLKQHWYSQLKVENFFQRSLEDYSIGKYDYYRGFALMNRIFNEHKIDLVIMDSFPEGQVAERLASSFAIERHIPVYTLEPNMLGKRIVSYNNAERLLPIKHESNLNLEDSMFYHTDWNHFVDDSPIYHYPVLKNPIIAKLEKLVYKLFGELGVDICSCLYTCSNRKNRFGVTFTERLENYYRNRSTKKYLDKISTEKFNHKCSYVYYSLHFEPESTVSSRTTMDSQLVALQILSNNLPPGWVVYVKEHPHQFLYNTRGLYGRNVAFFKSKRFYDSIKKMRNVKLLPRNTSNVELIRNAKAVASLSGTVTLEAISMNKPALLFGAEQTVYRYISDLFLVQSYKDCSSAIEAISNGFLPDYSDFENITNTYLFNDNKIGYAEAINAIKDDYYGYVKK